MLSEKRNDFLRSKAGQNWSIKLELLNVDLDTMSGDVCNNRWSKLSTLNWYLNVDTHKHCLKTWLKYLEFLPEIFVLFPSDPDREEAKRIDITKRVAEMLV